MELTLRSLLTAALLVVFGVAAVFLGLFAVRAWPGRHQRWEWDLAGYATALLFLVHHAFATVLQDPSQ